MYEKIRFSKLLFLPMFPYLHTSDGEGNRKGKIRERRMSVKKGERERKVVENGSGLGG